MKEKFDQIKEEAFEKYNQFMETLSNKDKIAITRFISSVVYYMQNNYRIMDPFEVIASFRISQPNWFDEIKSLFRQYYNVIKFPTVNFTEVVRRLDLERFETSMQFNIASIVSMQSKDAIVGGKIYYSSDSGVIMSVIPTNDIILSTFVLAHEVAHLTLAALGVDDIGEDNASLITIEMLCDYFAIFVYHRLTHISDKKQHENLSKTLKVIAANDDIYNSDEVQVREAHIKSVLDSMNLI